MKAIKNYLRSVKDNFMINTIVNAENAPIFTIKELFYDDMSLNECLPVRLTFLGLTYLGLGSAYNKIRESVYEKHPSLDQASFLKRTTFDLAYTAAFYAAISFPIYAGMKFAFGDGSLEWSDIASATWTGTKLGVLNYFPLLYSIDAAKDWLDIKEFNKPEYPKLLRNQNSNVKKLFYAGFLGATIATTLGAMHVKAEREEVEDPDVQIKQLFEFPKNPFDQQIEENIRPPYAPNPDNNEGPRLLYTNNHLHVQFDSLEERTQHLKKEWDRVIKKRNV